MATLLWFDALAVNYPINPFKTRTFRQLAIKSIVCRLKQYQVIHMGSNKPNNQYNDKQWK